MVEGWLIAAEGLARDVDWKLLYEVDGCGFSWCLPPCNFPSAVGGKIRSGLR